MHRPQKLIDYQSASEALSDLCNGMCAHEAACLKGESIEPSEVPEPFRKLLVHHEHMTTILGTHFGSPVALRVLNHQLDGDIYRRRIVLTLQSTRQVVEFGIVRIDLNFTTDEVRSQILDRAIPLGDILIKHNVLRSIQPRWYLKVSGHCPSLIGAQRLWIGDAYGRVGTIYCGDKPAIELLEIVTPSVEGETVGGNSSS